jgi:hypothetical protein
MHILVQCVWSQLKFFFWMILSNRLAMVVEEPLTGHQTHANPAGKQTYRALVPHDSSTDFQMDSEHDQPTSLSETLHSCSKHWSCYHTWPVQQFPHINDTSWLYWCSVCTPFITLLVLQSTTQLTIRIMHVTSEMRKTRSGSTYLTFAECPSYINRGKRTISTKQKLRNDINGTTSSWQHCVADDSRIPRNTGIKCRKALVHPWTGAVVNGRLSLPNPQLLRRFFSEEECVK